MVQLQLSIDNVSNNSFTLGIAWDHVYVPVKVNLPTADLVMKSIKEETNLHRLIYIKQLFIYYKKIEILEWLKNG